MNYYIFIDLSFLVLVLVLSYYFYQKALYEKLFSYFKFFVLLPLSAKFASYTAYILKTNNIIDADSYSVLILIAFGLNFLVLYYLYKYVFLFLDKFINSQNIKELLAILITVVEVVVIFSFLLYIFMQISVNKKHIQPTLNKTWTYQYTQKFYKKFLNYDFVYMITSSDSNINHKEILFKSFKNSF